MIREIDFLFTSGCCEAATFAATIFIYALHYPLISELPAYVHLLLIESLRIEILVFSLGIIVLLWLSFLISGGEHALFSITPSELNALEKKSSRNFKSIQHLIVRPRHLLVLVKMLQMIINVTILFLAARIGVHLFHHWTLAWVAYIIEIIVLILLLTWFQDIIPKYFAGRNNLLWAKWMGVPLYVLSNLLYPFVQFTIQSSNLIEKRFARSNEGKEEEVMQKPEEQLAEVSNDAEDTSLLKGILRFSSVVVRQVMRPRIDMVGIQKNITLENVLRIARETRYSRLPVYDGNADKIVGILYTKDLLALFDNSNNKSWQSLIRPAYRIPESKKISELLEELKVHQLHMAIVIDEYGRTAGLVTLEDLVEEIIGEVRDETDDRIEIEYIRESENSFVFEGKTSLNDFITIVGLPEHFFSELQSEADSLGGLLQEISGSIPEPNENIEYDGLKFTVLTLEHYRIKKVRVVKPEAQPGKGS